MSEISISSVTHPDYASMITKWDKFRYAYEGGSDFVGKYLTKFSNREDTDDFNNRKSISYCPAHAKAAVNDIKNSIYQRLIDITRTGGPLSYREAVDGRGSGVDLTGNTMDMFIGREVLPELLSMARVGVYVDRPELSTNPTIRETQSKQPYVYLYHTEDIRSWSYDRNKELTAVLLRDYEYTYDELTGLPDGEITTYRLLRRTEEGVYVTFYDEDSKIMGEYLLNLRQIPLVIFEISSSLLTDVADYQIALLNLASSDLNYALKSNFPFYTEQYDIRSEMANLLAANASYDSDGYLTDKPGTADEAGKAKDYNINVGSSQGRRYPRGLERPQFIHPSSEPLEASMLKQEKLQQEIRVLVNLTVSNLEPRSESAESKREDTKSLESGLSYIGMELEYGERQIGRIWADYERSSDLPTIKYPENYSLKTEADRRKEAEESKDLMPILPSVTYQKTIAKQIATIMVGHKTSPETLGQIHDEIDAAPVVSTDPEVVRTDHEAGFVGTETASKLRGYPDGEVEKAKVDHAERAARIALAQSQASARGVADMDNDDSGGKLEKEGSRDTSLDNDTSDKTRGDGQ